MENNTFEKDLAASTVMDRKLNRKQMRQAYGGKTGYCRSKAPRNIASRKPLPIPDNWEGWRNWKPRNKKAS